jgi:hypothetical protein
MNCLDEGALLRVSSGDATDAERGHAMACATCTQALAILQADLGRLGSVLGDGVPLRPTARRYGVRLVPLAAAAALVLAVVLARRTPVPVADGDELAMLDDLGTAVATYDVGGLAADDDGATTRSTCVWGEPLLQTGCDDDAPATLIAWR